MNIKTSTESAESDRNISLQRLTKRVSYARAGDAAGPGTGKLSDSAQKKVGCWAGAPGSPVRVICQNSRIKTKPIPMPQSNPLRSCLKTQSKKETVDYILKSGELDMVASISSEMRSDDLSWEEDVKKEETETCIVDAPSATSQNSNSSQSNLAKTKLSRLFANKKREFTRLKKTLIVQQNAILKHFDSLKDVARRLVRLGETAPLNEELQLVVAGERLGGGELPLALDRPGFQVIDELSAKIYQIPEALLASFNELLAQKDDFDDGTVVKIKLKKDSKDSISPDMMQELVVSLINCVRTKLSESLSLARKSWCERSQLLEQTSRAADELQAMRHRRDELERNRAAPLQDKTQFDVIIEELKKELSSEKQSKEAAREKLQQLEAQHRISRARVGDLEREIKEWETKVASLNASMRNLEQHLRVKDTGHESKVRKLRDCTQASESALEQLKVQRNALEMRIKELQAQIKDMSTAADETTVGLVSELQDLRQRQEVTHAELAAARDSNQTLQRLLDETRVENVTVEAKCRQVIEFFQQARPLLLDKEDKDTNESALSLWKELRGTRQALNKAAQEAACCRREKEKFLQTLSRMAEAGRGSKTNVVATDLLEKEHSIAELKKTVENLEKQLESTNDTVCKYESKISELHLRLLKVQTDQYSYHPTPSSDLEDQIVNLHGSLDHYAKQNDLLTTALVQKNILVERFDKSCTGQYQLLQMRSEILRFLERRGAIGADQATLLLGQSRSAIVNTVNKALKERFSEFGCKFSVVENYREEILTMEQLILMLQSRLQQNDRQRVFYEKKISELEHKLMDCMRFRQ